MRIGLLSDTHLPNERRTLWEEVKAAFQGVDLILHGGDIVHPMVLDWLEEIAPVLAAQGNNDWGWVDRRMSTLQVFETDGWRIAMIHDMEPEDRPIEHLLTMYMKNERPDVIVTGHTHFERLDYREGILQINPGSPIYPHLYSTRLGTVGILDLASNGLDAKIVRLGETEGRYNPCVEYAFSPATGIRNLGESAPRVQRVGR